MYWRAADSGEGLCGMSGDGTDSVILIVSDLLCESFVFVAVVSSLVLL